MVEEHIQSLLSASPKAQTAAKKLIADVTGKDIDLLLRTSLGDRLATIRASDEAQEGLSAFLEKRAAKWQR
jgi:methylglutaconyl-CoA hydratase